MIRRTAGHNTVVATWQQTHNKNYNIDLNNRFNCNLRHRRFANPHQCDIDIKSIGKRYMMRRAIIAAGVAAATMLAVGCSSSSSPSSAGRGDPVTLRLGFLTNITHAPALIGVEKGFFAKDLGASVKLQLVPFSTGTQEATALLAGQLDAAYVGPNPTIKAWQTSSGSLIRVISGAASGGAELVVKAGITSAAQLKGKKLATPSLGNTQDPASM